MSETPSVDWREYYDREGETKKFLPDHDPAEAMRVEFVERLLQGVSASSALDVGCGNGYLASRLLARGTERVAGIDFSRPRLRDASRQFDRIGFSRASGTALPCPSPRGALTSSPWSKSWSTFPTPFPRSGNWPG